MIKSESSGGYVYDALLVLKTLFLNIIWVPKFGTQIETLQWRLQFAKNPGDWWPDEVSEPL